MICLEEFQYDAMIEAAYEAAWDSAVDALKQEHGDREFTDEEVSDEIEEQQRVREDFDP